MIKIYTKLILLKKTKFRKKTGIPGFFVARSVYLDYTIYSKLLTVSIINR